MIKLYFNVVENITGRVLFTYETRAAAERFVIPGAGLHVVTVPHID